MATTSWKLHVLFVLLAACLFVDCGSDSDEAASMASVCTAQAPQMLADCVAGVNDAWQSCLGDGGAPCSDDDPGIVLALDTLEQHVRTACADGDFDGLSLEGVVGRWRYACRSEAASLAWRSFGGPQGASWDRTGEAGHACLLAVHQAGASVLEDRLASLNACLADSACDPSSVDADGQRTELALEQIASGCDRIVSLDRIIALDAPTFIERTAQQVDCLAAISHASPRFPLDCGPSNADANAIPTPPRGEYVRVVLDSDTWGTMCGDGSPYAFDIRLAPEGERLDRVVIGLQGGGVCFFNDDCSSRFRSEPGLFTAMDDQPPVTGIMSNDPADSDFAQWTKVYLPYCNQDVFIGGGITENFDALALHRSGAINLRAAVRAARDVLWRAMDAEGGDGYRPDELIALFGGWSAGGYGTMYNYHWVLDDLLWQRTTAFPDAGLGFDNGDLGVRSFGDLLIPVWNAMPYLPPYCFQGRCAVGPINFTAISPRLKQVPEQQYLIFSNQRDQTQQHDAFFDSEALFINTMRQGYCETKDLRGIQWYLTSESERSQHVVTLFPSFWSGEVDGIAMRDWVSEAIRDPDGVVDRAEEGDFTTAVPGVEPFPCEVAP
jgi:hypothetical protein